MRLTLTATGPAEGFPVPGCPCAACSRARREGLRREPARLESSDGWSVGVDARVTDEGRGSARVDGVVTEDPHQVAPGEPFSLGGTRFESPTAGVLVIRAPEGTVVWAPQLGEPADPRLDALAELLAGQAPQAVFLGPAADADPDDGEMPSLGSARVLARLRARGVIGQGTRCFLVGFGHRESHPARLAACQTAWGAVVPTQETILDLAAPEPAPTPSEIGRVLVLGGSGSGKSAFAEQMLSAAPEVIYLATGPKPVADSADDEGDEGDAPPTEHPEDDEWAARVRKHQNRRPGWWSTLETIDVAQPLAQEQRAILLDSVGTWLSGVLDRCGAWDDRPGWHEELDAEIDGLLAAWRERAAPLVAVSDEVGWSIVPATESGRLFRDQLGRLNAKLADASEDVFVVVAGRLVRADP